MKKVALLLAVVSIGAEMFAFHARAQNAEESAVRQALEHYIRGHAT